MFCYSLENTNKVREIVKRFDRVTAILLLLQTRSVVTAQFLSEHFDVSERTIYRDIRALETAGVPIGAEAGVGYFLEQSYRLPPVRFSLDEAAALLLGEKFLAKSLDERALGDFNLALNKVRAVIDNTDKDRLSALDAQTQVLPTGSHFPSESLNNPSTSSSLFAGSSVDPWLSQCRSALVDRRVIEIDYSAQNAQQGNQRSIEPIGLFYYNWHWHLIAWCRLRQGYRDFRLDRITAFSAQSEQFVQHDRLTLQQYLNDRVERETLEEVELLFTIDAAKFVEEQRYYFGFLDEEVVDKGVKMRFLTTVPQYMARWLLQYTNEVEVLKGAPIKAALVEFSAQLFDHWKNK